MPPALQPSEDVAVVRVDGRVCLHIASTAQVLVLNESATAVWDLLDGRRTAADVTAQLEQLHGVGPQLGADVDSVLSTFASVGVFGAVEGRQATQAPGDDRPAATWPEPDAAQEAEDLPAGWALSALDVQIVIRCSDRRLDDVLKHLTADLRARSDDHATQTQVIVRGHGPWTVESAGHSATVTTFSTAVEAALAATNLTAVALTPTLAFHAAVLARDTSALVVPGPSGQGKTTLTTALLQQGWDYVSDEALSIRWDDDVLVPYPRPLSLSPWAAHHLSLEGVPAGPDVVVRPSDLGQVAEPSRPLSLHHVVLLGPATGVQPQLEPLHRADGVAEVLRRGFTHVADPARALEVVARVTTGARVWRASRADPREMARLITSQLG